MKKVLFSLLLLTISIIMLAACSTDNTAEQSSSTAEPEPKAVMTEKSIDEETSNYFFSDESDHIVYEYTAPEGASSIEVLCRKNAAGRLKSEESLLKRDLNKDPKYRSGTISACTIPDDNIHIKMMTDDGLSSMTADSGFELLNETDDGEINYE